MITSVNIQGYRGFDRFEMSGLGRINLLVGTNNSGKTSVLEGIFLLMEAGDPWALWQLVWRRGERVFVSLPGPDREPAAPRRFQTELEVCHLFRGHEVHPGSKFSIFAKNQTPERSVSFAVTELSAKERADLFGPDDGTLPSRLALQIKGTPAPISSIIPLSRRAGIMPETLEGPRRSHRRSVVGKSVFITTESLTMQELVSLWNKVLLTPAEDLVLTALKFIDRDIERIGLQADTQPLYYGPMSRGGFLVKKSDIEQPIPIGSMGDGMWRLLAMAIAITQCRGGVLLVDEIDTGLHYTVMSRMWQLILNAAKQFNVQVFATTHSYDCVHSLAQICADADEQNPITVQRVEPGRPKAVPYSANEIRLAAERNIEMR
jgi:hypothetical protein